MTRTRLHTTLAFTLVLGLVTAGCFDQESSDPIVGPDFGILEGEDGPPQAFEVYTQNMFLGGQTSPLFELDFDVLSDPTDPGFIAEFQKLLAAVGGFWSEVGASDIPARVHEIADEIDLRRPDVVALQEAVGFVMLNPATMEPLPGQDFVAQDLLYSLEAEIALRQLPYEVAVAQPTTQGALPIEVDPTTFTPTKLLAFTDRVVLLRHTDIPEEDISTASDLYQCALCSIPLGQFDFVRGWARLTIDRDGTPWHFVATHLETQRARPIHDAQALQLQNSVLAGLDGNVVLMGDLNSDAAADPTAPSWTPTYGNLVDAGFVDIWEMSAGTSGDGLTCCLEPGRTLEERIDFVLLRSADGTPGGDDDGDQGGHLGFYRADVIGDEASDQTAGGLWPSDHAGLTASIRQPGTMR